ncbi:MAG: HugZ family protein [Gammaproteobacteria bacterium]
MSDEIENLERLAQEARTFMSGVRTLVLGTVSAGGEPEASYAPFVHRAGEGFYVYVSELSRHTRNLKANGRASALLLADEQDTRQLFARTRLTFKCSARAVARESDRWRSVLDEFEDGFGDVMQMIRPLTDFHLFELKAETGVYVRGFAQAYRFVGAGLEQFGHISNA